MLLDFYLPLSDRGYCRSCCGWGWDSPCSQLCTNTSALPPVRFQQLPGMQWSYSYWWFGVNLWVFTSTFMFDRLWIPKHPMRTALENQGQRKAHSPHLIYCKSYQRDLSKGNLSWASPPHPACASWNRKDRAEREQGFLPQLQLRALAGSRLGCWCHPSSGSQTPSTPPRLCHAQGCWQSLPAGCFCSFT